MIGAMATPVDFQYRDVLDKGYPEHCWTDMFRLKHPSMDNERRAKIFSPFDALKGFDEAIASKEVLYEDRLELDDDELKELGRRIGLIHDLTSNSRLARKNQVPVSVIYYVACHDKNNSAFGYRGQYVSIHGIVNAVTVTSIVVNGEAVPLKDITAIESTYTVYDRYLEKERPIFENEWCD